MMTIDASETDDRKKKNKILPYENNMDEPDPTHECHYTASPHEERNVTVFHHFTLTPHTRTY